MELNFNFRKEDPRNMWQVLEKTAMQPQPSPEAIMNGWGSKAGDPLRICMRRALRIYMRMLNYFRKEEDVLL